MSAAFQLDLQIASEQQPLPNQQQLLFWFETAVKESCETAEITVRIVDLEESQQLNSTYRNKDKPTNILSFPFEIPEGVLLDVPMLGDLVVCAPVVATEAEQQHKSLMAHWAHMIVHGCLHLLGYDHIENSDAEAMETLERKIMAELGFADPYQEIN